MANTRVVIKVSPGKSRGGTIVARRVVKVRKTPLPQGKPIYQTRAQLNVHISSKNGERR